MHNIIISIIYLYVNETLDSYLFYKQNNILKYAENCINISAKSR